MILKNLKHVISKYLSLQNDFNFLEKLVIHQLKLSSPTTSVPNNTGKESVNRSRSLSIHNLELNCAMYASKNIA